MKKIITIALLLFVSMTIFAEEYPEWVRKPSSMNTNERIFANGTGKKQTKTMSLKAAQLDANANLAGYINMGVNAVTRSMREEVTASGEALESVEYFTEVIESNAQANLSLVQQEDVYEAEDGQVWVLVSMPLEIVLKQISNGVKKVTKEDERNSSVMKKYAEEIRTRSNETFTSYFTNKDEDLDVPVDVSSTLNVVQDSQKEVSIEPVNSNNAV